MKRAKKKTVRSVANSPAAGLTGDHGPMFVRLIRVMEPPLGDHRQMDNVKPVSIDSSTMGKSMSPPPQPIIERLGFLASRVRDTAEFIDLFRCRLTGGPSTLNPPQQNAPTEELPTDIGALLGYLEDRIATNHNAIAEIAARF